MATDHNFKVKKGLHVLGSEGVYLTDTNTRLHEGSGNALRITTGTGYIDIGSMNSGWVHMQANKNIYILPNISNGYVSIDGHLQPYSDSTRTLGGNTVRWSHTYTDNITVTDDVTIGGTISSGAITSSGIITSAMTGNAKLIADGSGSANVEIDRGSTSYHNNLLYRTGGAVKWRIWQSGADNVLAVRNEVAGSNVLTFTDTNSAFVGNVSITGGNTDGSGNAFVVYRGGNSQEQALRIENSGEVVVANSYLYASYSGGTSFYSQGQAIFRNGIANDSGDLAVKDNLAITNSGVLKIGSTTVIDSSRNVENVVLTNGTSGAKLKADGWHYDHNNEARFYFQNSASSTGRTYYRADGGHHFRANGDVTRLNINQSGGINLLSAGDTQVGSTVAIGVAGTTVLDTSRNLTNIGTINTGQGATEVYLMNQNVRSSDSPTFADLTVTGNLNITGDINSYNVTDLDVTDKTITLGVGGTASANDGAGIIIDGSNASLKYDNSDAKWAMNRSLQFDDTPTTTNQNLGVFWTAFDKEGTTDFSDAAYIRHTANIQGLAGSVLEIKSNNDANDGIAFTTNSSSLLKHNSNNIFTDAYHPNADTLTTARTIAGTSFDGSANIDISYDNLTNKPTNIANSDTVDSLHASSFLRSDADDTATGKLYFTGGSGTVPALHVKSGGNSWSEGLAVHPLTDSGYALTFFRTRASFTDQTNTWGIGNLGGSGYQNYFGLLRRSLTGGVADRTGDAVFTVSTSGTLKFGFDPYVGSNKIWHAGNDGSNSGLDADLLDGVQGSNYVRRDVNTTLFSGNASLAFENQSSFVRLAFYKFSLWEWNVGEQLVIDGNTFEVKSSDFRHTGSYAEFGDSTGSVSNDGSWNARLNVAGSSHARIDAKSVSDGIITTMYAHTGHGVGRVGTMSNHSLSLMVNGNSKATLDSSGNLDIDGNIEHTGLTMTSGTDVDQLYSVTKSLTLSTSWQDTGIIFSNLATGSYIIQLYANDHSVGGQHYSEYYTGVMSWYASNTNSSNTDEILLHRAGHASNNGDIFLRTARNTGNTSPNLHMEIRGSTSNTGASNYVFKFRRLI